MKNPAYEKYFKSFLETYDLSYVKSSSTIGGVSKSSMWDTRDKPASNPSNQTVMDQLAMK